MLCKRFKIQFCRSLTLKNFNPVPNRMQSDLLDYLDYKTLVLSLNWEIFIIIALLAHCWLCWLTCCLLLFEIYTKVTELPELVKVFDCPIWILEKKFSLWDWYRRYAHLHRCRAPFFEIQANWIRWELVHCSPWEGGYSPLKLTGMFIVTLGGLNWWIGIA